MNTLRTMALLAALAAAALSPAPSFAQDGGAPAWGQARGFSLGLKFLLDGLGADEADNPLGPVIDDIGPGLALCGGYTFTPNFHVRVTLGAAAHATDVPDLDVTHSVATIEGHYRFSPGRQVCPYVLGSLGGTDARADHGADHVKFSGGMAGFGAGLLVGFTPHLALDLTGRLDGINWTKAEYSQDQPGGGTLKYEDAIEDSGGSARLELGLLWQF